MSRDKDKIIESAAIAAAAQSFQVTEEVTKLRRALEEKTRREAFLRDARRAVLGGEAVAAECEGALKKNPVRQYFKARYALKKFNTQLGLIAGELHCSSADVFESYEEMERCDAMTRRLNDISERANNLLAANERQTAEQCLESAWEDKCLNWLIQRRAEREPIESNAKRLEAARIEIRCAAL